MPGYMGPHGPSSLAGVARQFYRGEVRQASRGPSLDQSLPHFPNMARKVGFEGVFARFPQPRGFGVCHRLEALQPWLLQLI